MDIAGYLDEVIAKFRTGQATEHSYRPALQRLFESVDPALTVINEPKRSDAGMPDFIFQRKEVPLGWCEAKDIDKDVIALKGYSVEQRKRYEKAYPNLIYTNGVDFEFIREGQSVHFVSIADFVVGLQPRPDNFDELARQLKLFAEAKPISIRSAAKLAEFMAAKAAIIKDEIDIALGEDPECRTGLGGQFKSFKQNLLPALTPGEFADIYAETITYGMFAARFHDTDLSTFSRQEAMERLPASNPFLKGLFEYIAGPQLPSRLKYIVDDLVQVMRASDPHSLFRDFGKFTARNDPFIHFYEDFLAAYNPKKRKSRGVWYTPEPVVDFIVRAVDDVLKTEFGLADGLADTSKVTVDWDTGTNDPKTGKARTIRKDVHKVQILDPATGTGTFLAKAVQLISDRVKVRAPGMWSSYVENDLLPRMHGFELLMASYAMCHMKLDMQLTESGYTPSEKPPRLSVWLTNALEPAEREVRDLFFLPLAEEARGASEVKRQTPIMCVIGNPPYSGISQNKGDWITGLIEDYKYVDGEHFGERKHWLQDDYVKFIRMAEHLISQNPSGGVLGFITNHGYLDNPTFRGMRWHLLTSFDRVWILDLHGNSKKGETSPDGSADVNVFDIQQGVSIIIAGRFGNKRKTSAIADVLHRDYFGSRKSKNEALWEAQLSQGDWTRGLPAAPYFMLSPVDHRLIERYEQGFPLAALFRERTVGFVTAKDAVNMSFSLPEAREKIAYLKNSSDIDIRKRFSIAATDARDWKVPTAKLDAIENASNERFTQALYRPFDVRFTCYTGKSRGLYASPQQRVMKNLLGVENLAITASSINRQRSLGYYFITKFITDFHVHDSIGDSTSVFPLYIYPQQEAGQADAFNCGRPLNLDPKLYAAICEAAGIDPADTVMAREKSLSLSLEGEGGAPIGAEGVGVPRSGGVEPPPPTPPQGEGSKRATPPQGEGSYVDFRTATGDARPSEVKVFDYIYGVLHSPDYRRTFAEFLKIDFPRVPYPPSPDVFRHVSDKGEALRRLHLMEPAAIGETPYPLMGEGSGEVASGYPKFEAGKVHINPSQYFDGVPQVAWEFHIGGYQPAQKWLKDRRSRTLSWDDIGHYQKIVKILIETDRIMREIELPLGTTP